MTDQIKPEKKPRRTKAVILAEQAAKAQAEQALAAAAAKPPHKPRKPRVKPVIETIRIEAPVIDLAVAEPQAVTAPIVVAPPVVEVQRTTWWKRFTAWFK